VINNICSIKACGRQIHQFRIMCFEHYKLVSTEVKRRLWRFPHRSPGWHSAVNDAINEVLLAQMQPRAEVPPEAVRESGKDRQYRD
jgi:hypothetical protein